MSQADVGEGRRAKSFFSEILESFKKYLYQIGSMGDRFRLGSSVKFWPSIVTALRSQLTFEILCKVPLRRRGDARGGCFFRILHPRAFARILTAERACSYTAM